MSNYKTREIILINEETGERVQFSSINGAAAFLSTNFFQVQRAALFNGVVKGWRAYESAEAIRKHIEELENQLKIVEE